MTRWTDISNTLRKAFPVVPISLREGYQAETQSENARRVNILGLIGLLLTFLILLLSDRLISETSKLSQLGVTVITACIAVWMIGMVVYGYYLSHGSRIGRPIFFSAILNFTVIFFISWSFLISMSFSTGGFKDWLYLVVVFLVFSLLLFSWLEILIVASLTLLIQVVTMEFVFDGFASVPSLFGISFAILCMASLVSRILYYTRVRNYINWENINQMNLTLKREVSLHLKTMEELEGIRQDLDQQVHQQTKHLRDANLRLSEEVAERRFADKVRTILYRMSTFVNGHSDLNEVFEFIHEQLISVMEARNFFVGRVGSQLNIVETLFERGESEIMESLQTNRLLCADVLEKEKPFVLNKRNLQEYQKSGKLPHGGLFIKSWLGIPLRVEGEVIGVLVIYSNHSAIEYDQTDVELLEYVSEHVVMAISRNETEQSLIAAKERAEESDRLKSTFLANLSHEIRTPMNAIVGFSELLNDHELDKDDRKYYSQQVLTNSDYLLNLISNIIELSKIQSGEHMVVNSWHPVRKSMLDLKRDFDNLRQGLSRTHLHIEYSLDESFVEESSFYGDLENFKTVLYCLVDNALKFTNEGGVIIGARAIDQQRVIFFVRDTGIGIDSDDMPRIFDSFRQGSMAISQLYRGTGLGLALAKALVGEQSGRIWVESEPGVGSCFYFTYGTDPEAHVIKNLPKNHHQQDQDPNHQASAG